MGASVSDRTTRFASEYLNCVSRLGGKRYTTEDQPVAQRVEWLKEVIGREWANVDISVPNGNKVYNDILIYPWRDGMRLSPMRSNPVCLSRIKEPLCPAQDCYNLVLLTSGQYKLEQGGREIYLEPGDMTLYDVTQPHRITIPVRFSKVLISVPRALLEQRTPNIANLTATRLSTGRGIGAVASSMICSTVDQLDGITHDQYMDLANHVLDFVTMAVSTFSEQPGSLTRHRRSVLMGVKAWIKSHLQDGDLDATGIAAGVGLSIRYLNDLFSDEGTSVMRYVTRQRLESSRHYLASHLYDHEPITTIAMRCGFNNMAHFSRVFKQAYGESPRTYRSSNPRK